MVRYELVEPWLRNEYDQQANGERKQIDQQRFGKELPDQLRTAGADHFSHTYFSCALYRARG